MAEQSPEVGPEHRRLDAFVGRWQGKGRILSGAPNDAGSDALIDDSYEWMPGGFFLVHRGSMKFEDQNLESIQVIGADAASGAYPSDQFDSMGFHREYEGRVNGDTWTFTGHSERASLTLGNGDTTLTACWERTEDGTTWLPICEYTAIKAG